MVCWDRPSYVYEPRMLNRFLKVFSIFEFKFKLSQRYIANAIGAACNLRIPPANLHAGLNFKPLKYSLETFLVRTVVQNVLRLPE